MPSVLLVDDEASLVHIVARMARGLSYDVRTASRATEALDLLVAEAVDVVVTDINLRGMNGCALARQVVQRWPATRILCITGYDYDMNRLAECVSMPVLTKPFSREEFRDKLAQVLRDPPWNPEGET